MKEVIKQQKSSTSTKQSTYGFIKPNSIIFIIILKLKIKVTF